MRRREVARELGDRVTFERRTFLLLPGEGQRPIYDEYIISHRRRVAQMAPELGYAIPQVGAPYPRSSVPPQLLALRVKQVAPEREDALEDALFRAFFARLEDISDPAVMRRCAQEAGVAPEEVDRALADPVLREQAFREHQEAIDLGIGGIPTLLAGGRPITGAVDVDIYRRALRFALEHAQDLPRGPTDGG